MKKPNEIQAASWKKPLTRFAAAALCSAMLAGTVPAPAGSIAWVDEITEDTDGAVDSFLLSVAKVYQHWGSVFLSACLKKHDICV